METMLSLDCSWHEDYDKVSAPHFLEVWSWSHCMFNEYLTVVYPKNINLQGSLTSLKKTECEFMKLWSTWQ